MMEAKLSNNFLSISFVSRLDEEWTKYRQVKLRTFKHCDLTILSRVLFMSDISTVYFSENVITA